MIKGFFVINLTISFPVPELNPNCCCHWAQRAKARKDARLEGKSVSLSHCLAFTKKDALEMTALFYPPKKRRLDLDNCLASLKGQIDGICDGLRVNDRQIKRITIERMDYDGNPRVEIQLSRIP